jgi:hypothetical protein
MRCTARESGLVHICIIFVRVVYAFGAIEIYLEILMKFSRSVLSLMLAMAATSAYAGNFADAAGGNGQAGGNAPAEMDLLGSPRTYTDPYGAPTNGRGGQRGPITNTQTGDGVTPTDKLLAQQNGYVGNPGAGAQLKGTAAARARDDVNAKAMMMPQGAADAVYPTPAGLKPPANPARVRDIYKSPY